MSHLLEVGTFSASAVLRYESKNDLDPTTIDRLLHMTAENLRFAKAVSGRWVIGCVLRERKLLKVAAELGYDKSPQITYEDFEKGEYGWCEISEPKKYNWSHRTLKRKQIFSTKIEN